ncbi:peptide chain release factor N(5)-glutamine methyltransferase [Maritalea mediterranea]|uniref:Release factor glutamine methyltransferase n=1 Tax=Maritalea mediterranea TaxID=2909667 RepID=A0ABS9E9F2_9HYPH|nr:peptide chain release factor N(5)-glutamine methyltransferase [Maritalea mediterranea]MCF4099507.1 peptide chain release factor N(5)-glutamine methyltransferase [Maritalea mediterranea]
MTKTAKPYSPLGQTFGQLRLYWKQQFAASDIATAALDARLLLCAAAELDQARLIAKEHDPAPSDVADHMADYGQRRLAHEPVARILGFAEFYGLRFGVNADTLVPRPETEMLVERALVLLPKGGRFLDLGTGTGCIAISIAHESPDLAGMATDIAPGALDMATQNAQQHGVDDRLALIRSDWFAAVPAAAQFDLIISNPPYIAESERNLMNEEALRFDPAAALFAPDEGMAAFRQILLGAQNHLKPGGKLLFEFGFQQANALELAAKDAGATQVTFSKDFSGHNRMAEISYETGQKASTK